MSLYKTNRLRALRRDNYTCQYCFAKLTKNNTTVDHVIPRQQGGSNEVDNLKACCFSCNQKKSKKEYYLIYKK